MQFGSWWTWRPAPAVVPLQATWPGLPDDVQIAAAQTYTNDRLYIFVAGGRYYRWNGVSRLQGPDVNNNNPYPRETAVWWLECSEIESALIDVYPPEKISWNVERRMRSGGGGRGGGGGG